MNSLLLALALLGQATLPGDLAQQDMIRQAYEPQKYLSLGNTPFFKFKPGVKGKPDGLYFYKETEGGSLFCNLTQEHLLFINEKPPRRLPRGERLIYKDPLIITGKHNGVWKVENYFHFRKSPRTWTDKSNKFSCLASVQRITKRRVELLKSDGKKVWVKRSILSSKDKKYLSLIEPS